MKKIVKVIFDDDSSLEVENFEGLKTSKVTVEKFKLRREYDRQFKSLEEDILRYLPEDVIENYAEWNLEMVNERDVEEKDINDFSDQEVLEEAKARKLFGENTSIISDSFFDRFGKIMIKENAIHLDSLLTELETKLKIIP